ARRCHRWFESRDSSRQVREIRLVCPKMSASLPDPRSPAAPAGFPRRIGLLVHPTRNVDVPLGVLREWAQRHGVEIVQLAARYPQRAVTKHGEASDTDVIVSIGGDGTTLAALRAGA